MAQNRRPVKRQLSFTAEEYERLRTQAELLNRPFATHVRRAALGQPVVAPLGRFDRTVLLDLTRLGNHLGEIACRAEAAGAGPLAAEVRAALVEHRTLMTAFFAVIRAERGVEQADSGERWAHVGEITGSASG